MKTSIIRIGNSQGIRIPKWLLEAAGLQTEVNLTAKRGVLTIRTARSPRAGWAAAFQAVAQRGDDAPLADVHSSVSEWDEEEWEWE